MNLNLLWLKLSYQTMMNKFSCCVRASLICVALFMLIGTTNAQTTSYKLTSREKAFMCPFLTPIFMNELTKAGAQDVRKDEHLIIHLEVPAATALDSINIYRIAGQVGFLPSIFTIEKTEK